jgi:hypothetical protein
MGKGDNMVDGEEDIWPDQDEEPLEEDIRD